MQQVKKGCGLLQEALPTEDGALGGEKGNGGGSGQTADVHTFTCCSENKPCLCKQTNENGANGALAGYVS